MLGGGRELQELSAKLHGELAAKGAELRGDVAALRTELLQKMQDLHWF